MKYKNTILGIGIVSLFALFASFPLLGKGYIPTHDGEYHIIRFIEFFRMISTGYWFPRWAPTLNSGYGIPIFLFHYPFPNYIGAVIQGLGFHAVTALKLSLAFGYGFTGICSFLWLRKLFGTKAGITGAIVSSFVPYWFVDIYVRGSVGEVWAMTFVFAALLFCEYGMLIPFSLAIAGLILSHNILGILFLPFIFGIVILRKRRLWTAYVLGILLTSYFWIPALLERNYVVGLNTVNFREHFASFYELIIPSWGTALSGQMFGSNKMSYQIGIIPVLVIFISLLYGIREKIKDHRKLYWYFFSICLISIALTMSFSSILWKNVPVLQFVQYPWRFLSFLIPVSAFMAAYVSAHIRMRIASILLILLSVSFAYSYTRPVVYAPRDDQYYLSRKNFTDGTSSMGNSFSTIWTGWKDKRPEYLLKVVNGQIRGDLSRNTYLDKKFTVVSEIGAEVDLPILYYPGWMVSVDKKEIPIEYQKDGTIRFQVPSGNHSVSVIFSETIIRKAADTLSIITLVWLIGWGILRIYASSYRHKAFKGGAREARSGNLH